MGVITNLGQNFVNLLSGLTMYLTDEHLLTWLPADIQVALGGLILILLIIGIKRAVFV